MLEIGSEFWDVPTTNIENGIFNESIQWFLSGRIALKSIIKRLKGCKTVAIPSWCCDSMIRPFIEAGIDIHFYPVYFDGQIVQEYNYDCDILFVMDYFGFTSVTPDLAIYDGIVIRDVTHSIFNGTPTDADYCFGSLRKWCGVWTGGYAWSKRGDRLSIDDTNDYGYTMLREIEMTKKDLYIYGKTRYL